MTMDQRGQISLEFVLIIALMAVIVGAVGWYVGDANEQNVISSAVRSAADNATTTLSLNRSILPTRVEDITTSKTNNGSVITLQINLSGSLSTSQKQNITNSTLSSMAAQGYNVTMANNSIVTNRYTYIISVV